jgi:hypothetical protein
MTPYEASGLLIEIVGFAQEILCRPPTGDLDPRRLRCEALEGTLEAAIAASGTGARFLDNAAPALLHAVDRSLYCRHLFNEIGAKDWDGVIGHLMPIARADAGAALASMHDTPERPTR